MKKHFKTATKEPSLKEIGSRFLTILIILAMFLLGIMLFFGLLTLKQTLPKIIFYVGFGLLFFFLMGIFVFFVIACVRYVQTEVNRQKAVFKQAVKKVKGGENRWQ
ncbi:hypothetical protein MPC59_003041 [Listeria monocytogenes]|nr:hypothetical protein [Listeria monocytogenes]EIZ6653610.1 hypothetical protein [Listeria monocytogenes]HDT8000328.1 hypothetical protein [Enterococcus faecalis]HDT8188132.1 hypothetical protein [Enterococcus faecalis]